MQPSCVPLFGRAISPPLVLEEIAATAAVSFEQAWYVVGDLIEFRLMTPAGLGAYHLTVQGEEAANRLCTSAGLLFGTSGTRATQRD